jgi:hypothetical protein
MFGSGFVRFARAKFDQNWIIGVTNYDLSQHTSAIYMKSVVLVDFNYDLIHVDVASGGTYPPYHMLVKRICEVRIFFFASF